MNEIARRRDARPARAPAGVPPLRRPRSPSRSASGPGRWRPAPSGSRAPPTGGGRGARSRRRSTAGRPRPRPDAALLGEQRTCREVGRGRPARTRIFHGTRRSSTRVVSPTPGLTRLTSSMPYSSAISLDRRPAGPGQAAVGRGERGRSPADPARRPRRTAPLTASRNAARRRRRRVRRRTSRRGTSPGPMRSALSTVRETSPETVEFRQADGIRKSSRVPNVARSCPGSASTASSVENRGPASGGVPRPAPRSARGRSRPCRSSRRRTPPAAGRGGRPGSAARPGRCRGPGRCDIA